MDFKTALLCCKISWSQRKGREERSLKGEYSQKFPLKLWLHVAVSLPTWNFLSSSPASPSDSLWIGLRDSFCTPHFALMWFEYVHRAMSGLTVTHL